jgi:TRAP-type C4-dicarboxylate transport system permease small subunit
MTFSAANRFFQKIVTAIGRAAAFVAALILAGMTALIIFEIFIRTVFSTSTHITEEFVAYGLASLIFLTFAYALEQGALIRVDLIIVRLPHRVRFVTELITILVTFAVVVFVTKYIWNAFARYWKTGAISWSPAEVPLWIPQIIVIIGIVLFCLQLIAYFLRLATGGPLLSDEERFE